MFVVLEDLPEQPAARLKALRAFMGQLPGAVVAYSGGVDSTLVAAIAAEQLGARAIAVTGVSPALAPHLRQEAATQAHWLGIRHREISTTELDEPAYSNNPSDRCYACKRELHLRLTAQLPQLAPGATVVVDGVNQDDLADHRPGITAAKERGVRSPLAELGISKADVRHISRALGFPWWDKPAQPCLASRFPYGEPISASRLQRVAAAEAWLLQRGFREVRVRSQGDAARIEVGADQLDEALGLWRDPQERQRLISHFLELGFTAVGVDLEGLVSGKLNRSLSS